MTHVNPGVRRYPKDWEYTRDAEYPSSVEVTETDPTIKKLYGPKGEVLRTISDRPPIGFAAPKRETP